MTDPAEILARHVSSAAQNVACSRGRAQPAFLTIRIMWSVNAKCMSGTSYLGMWHVVQFSVATTQTRGVFAAPAAAAAWHAVHRASYAPGSRTSGVCGS